MNISVVCSVPGRVVYKYILWGCAGSGYLPDHDQKPGLVLGYLPEYRKTNITTLIPECPYLVSRSKHALGTHLFVFFSWSVFVSLAQAVLNGRMEERTFCTVVADDYCPGLWFILSLFSLLVVSVFSFSPTRWYSLFSFIFLVGIVGFFLFRSSVLFFYSVVNDARRQKDNFYLAVFFFQTGEI